MFGKNPVRKSSSNPGSLQVQDVWYTIQGEGPYSGHPAVFVRLTGCNLRCWFCDTAWDDEHDAYVLTDTLYCRIRDLLKQHGCKLVVLTGGEPLRQDLSELMNRFEGQGVTFQIETAGSLWQECVDRPWVKIIVSPKTGKVNDNIAAHATAYKYVIRDGFCCEKDGLPTYLMQNIGVQPQNKQGAVARPPAGVPVYVMPCDEQNNEKNLHNTRAVAKLAMKHGYIAQVQAHKVFMVP